MYKDSHRKLFARNMVLVKMRYMLTFCKYHTGYKVVLHDLLTCCGATDVAQTYAPAWQERICMLDGLD